MNKYSRVFPPSFATSSPAALADPPSNREDRKFNEAGLHTSGNQVVDDDNSLTGLDGIGLHFKRVLRNG